MAANSHSSKAKLDVAKQHLQHLKAPAPVTSTWSTYQKQMIADQERGRKIWKEVVGDYRGKQSPANRTSGTNFLDLPAELRNIIYTICLDDDKKLRRTRERFRYNCCNRQPTPFSAVRGPQLHCGVGPTALNIHLSATQSTSSSTETCRLLFSWRTRI
jgi:hypothetical protein